ncbi:hypothetical protein ACT80S_18690 [Ramlibacter sp. MAHUQ-53]|uniref:hypothetical protein n=1 Tax=unclassified Ramlibacter TaxID=2617605 RepID=UPI0036333702
MVWDIVVAVAGLAVGALLAAVFLRVRLHDLLEAAVAHGRAGLDVEVATQAERLRLQDTELLQARQDLLRLQQAAERLHRELEACGDDRARFAERATRVPALEAQVARLELQLRMAHQEVVRLADAARHPGARRVYSRALPRRPNP